MADTPCLSLFRQGLDTVQIAEHLGLPDEAAAYNLLSAERDLDRASQRFDAAVQEHISLTETGKAWAEENARKLAALLVEPAP